MLSERKPSRSAAAWSVAVVAAIALFAAWSTVAVADMNESADRSFQAGQITGGIAHGCAVSLDGSIRCWGSDTSGQLGDGTVATPTNNSSPRGPVASVGAPARSRPASTTPARCCTTGA